LTKIGAAKFDELPLKSGTKVIYDNSICEIVSVLSLDQIILRDINEGHTFAAKIADIKSADTIMKAAALEPHAMLGSTKDWEKAKEREKVILYITI
jgi:hypothetical protein